MHTLGVIHGRFQILHNDHLKYILAGKERCRHLVIGITNPDPNYTKADPANPERSLEWANPLSYFERYAMVALALEEMDVKPQEFSIVPFPINIPELYSYYVPLNAVFYLTIYDGWGERKLALFQSLGLKTEVMWTRTIDKKGITASMIRSRIIQNKPWKHLVPTSVKNFICSSDIIERLKIISTTLPLTG